MQGKAPGGAVEFACTFQGRKGAVAGPLGSHLLLAVANVVAMGCQDKIILLEEPTKPGPSAPSLSKQGVSQDAGLQYQERKHLRSLHLGF